MQPEARREAQDWLVRAERDLEAAETLLARVCRKSAGAMLQQFVFERLAHEERGGQDQNGR